MNKNNYTRLRWFLPLLLIVITLAIFITALNHDFVKIDDDKQVVDNPLIRSLKPASIYRMFTTLSITRYYPVRLLSFAIDYSLWGLNPMGYHLTNILIHIVNILLVYLLIFRFKDFFETDNLPINQYNQEILIFFSVSLFAIHPVIVEPVAWVAGREELLMVFFTLLALHFHISGSTSPLPSSPLPSMEVNVRRIRLYRFLTGLSGMLACMSNVVGAVIPMMIASYDLCLTQKKARSIREKFKKIFINTWFLWGFSIGAIILKKFGDTFHITSGPFFKRIDLTWSERILTILNTFWLNIRTLIWPDDLVISHINIIPTQLFEPGVLIGGGLVLFILFRLRHIKKNPLMLLGILWFLIGLAPSSQVILHQIFQADRFLYLPMVGLVLTTVCVLVKSQANKNHPKALAGLCIFIMCIIGIRSGIQVRHWRNNITLFEHILKIEPDNSFAHNNLGGILAEQGKLKKAIVHYTEALRLDPDHINAHNNLGVALIQYGKSDEAIEHLSKALRLKPNHAEALYNFGLALAEQGKIAEAIKYYSKSLSIKPYQIDALYKIGLALAKQGKITEAIDYYYKALKIAPNHAKTHNNLGVALAKSGKIKEAIRHHSEALRINPDYAMAHYNLGADRLSLGQNQKAVSSFSKAYKIFLKQFGENHPDTRDALKRLLVLCTSEPNIPVCMSRKGVNPSRTP